MAIEGNELIRIIKQQRVAMDLTLSEVSEKSGVSLSHLSRIEQGERFPSGRVLRKIAKPLELKENELFVMAGYLSPTAANGSKQEVTEPTGRIDPYIAVVLGKESVETQRKIIAILLLLKSAAKGII